MTFFSFTSGLNFRVIRAKRHYCNVFPHPLSFQATSSLEAIDIISIYTCSVVRGRSLSSVWRSHVLLSDKNLKLI